MKTKLFVLANAVFGIVLLTIYLAHINFLDVNVVFYAAIADGVLAAVVAFSLLWLPFGRGFNPFEKFQMLLIWLLLGYAFAISVPTVIDRSLSFYILEKLEQRGGGIRQDAMKDVFTQEYLKEHRLVDVRLTEQIESGTIVIENGCVKLTEKGRRLSTMSRYYRLHFLPKHRLLMGEYTDDLTNPFRNSQQAGSYACR
ncbi:hypothetical protein GCM10027046_27820 [Uliginosibacterium flavum]|uniref:Uncharacterized protein n=1 Tax=Uliginosibacterium flavum TaxID=1396831 RepID=A0ABV2TH04_9RHOO